MAEDSKSLSQERYSRFARRYVESPDHAQGDDLEQLVWIAQPNVYWKVLDIATGGGHTALKFAPFVTEVLATDLTPNMLMEARRFTQSIKINNLTFLATDAEALSLPDARFDLITCRIAPHHFPNCKIFIHEAARVLKPGGILLIEDHMLPEEPITGDYIDEFERLRDPSHYHAFSRNQWIHMYNEAGLVVEQIETIRKRHDFTTWVERQSCSPQVIGKLIDMVIHAPQGVEDWLQPRDFPTQNASFAHIFIIISGRKS